jgi:hypothetical protein
MMYASTRFLGHRCYWWWHLLVIQKSFALFQIVSCGTMDLTPFLYIDWVIEQSLHLLIRGLLLVIPMVSAISVIPVISSIGRVDLLIILLLL